MDINKRIKRLREQLETHQFDAYIIPSTDPHQSEYVADHWKCREWISGFTGSQGTVVVTRDHAGLWADSRYFIQAEMELEQSEMVLHKVYKQGSPDFIRWLSENLKSGSIVACDGLNFSIGQINSYKKSLAKNDIMLNYEKDLIDFIWENRPKLPDHKIFEHDVKYAGKSRKEKLHEVRTKMNEQGADYHLITTLDDIAWLFNIRSKDVDYNPVTIAYAVVSKIHAVLFINVEKVELDLMGKLAVDNISVVVYEGMATFLGKIEESEKIFVDTSSCNMKLYEAINPKSVIPGYTISRYLKSVKNDTEKVHIREVMVKDGVALTRLYMWLDKELKERTVTEAELADKLAWFRSQQDGYFGESFSAIVGYEGNGAIIHYRPEHGKSAEIKPQGILLLDSGGQYLNGTTDTTRTTALSEPSHEVKENFTRVLKGHIALANARFPSGTTGVQLDILARKYLWDIGLNYLHGTGHGVGFFLNVHEPPQRFTNAPNSASRISIEEGMLTSNEPGYYKEDHYGIRIENLVLAKKSETGDEFLDFETVTLFPIDLNLVDIDLLTEAEREWLNQYHAYVNEKLSPLLDEEEKLWMAQQCRVI